MIYTGTYWPLHMTTTVPQTVSQCTLCMLYNSEIPSSTHTLTHWLILIRHLFFCLIQTATCPLIQFIPHFPSISSTPPSMLLFSLCPQINHGSNTTPSPPTCLLSFCVLNSAHTLQLSCLCGISSGWIVYFCMRPNANVPISVTLWKL